MSQFPLLSALAVPVGSHKALSPLPHALSFQLICTLLHTAFLIPLNSSPRLSHILRMLYVAILFVSVSSGSCLHLKADKSLSCSTLKRLSFHLFYYNKILLTFIHFLKALSLKSMNLLMLLMFSIGSKLSWKPQS